METSLHQKRSLVVKSREMGIRRSGIDFDGDDDDGDDDLLVKKDSNTSQQTVPQEDEAEDLDAPGRGSKKSSKPLTKYALAKKIRKKNLQINTKKVFDEEGEVR